MPNPAILVAVTAAWSNEPAIGKRILDLSCGGHTSQMFITDFKLSNSGRPGKFCGILFYVVALAADVGL